MVTNPSFGTASSGDYPFGDYDPKISPDGTKIASYRHLDDSIVIGTWILGNWDIFVCDLDGSNETFITSTSSVAEIMPTWSPDSSKLAFWAIDGALPPDPIDFFIMNPDGTGLTNATAGQGRLESMPDWFPDANFSIPDGSPDLIYTVEFP